jgi:hypothetical protein
MKRPKGVTVMACIFLFMAISVVHGSVRDLPQMLENRGWLLLSAVNLLFTVPVGVGLLKMQSWSRCAGIAVCAASLVLIPQAVVAAHSLSDIIRAGLRTLFFVWVIWYLSQPHVKAAFRTASPVQASNSSQ